MRVSLVTFLLTKFAFCAAVCAADLYSLIFTICLASALSETVYSALPTSTSDLNPQRNTLWPGKALFISYPRSFFICRTRPSLSPHTKWSSALSVPDFTITLAVTCESRISLSSTKHSVWPPIGALSSSRYASSTNAVYSSSSPVLYFAEM